MELGCYFSEVKSTILVGLGCYCWPLDYVRQSSLSFQCSFFYFCILNYDIFSPFVAVLMTSSIFSNTVTCFPGSPCQLAFFTSYLLVSSFLVLAAFFYQLSVNFLFPCIPLPFTKYSVFPFSLYLLLVNSIFPSTAPFYFSCSS